MDNVSDVDAEPFTVDHDAPWSDETRQLTEGLGDPDAADENVTA